jgi:hypothetical protein
MDTLRAQLCRTKPEDESFQPLKKALLRLVAAEGGAVEREYEIFLQEHVTNTRSARVAATAPSHAQWAAIIRQQNSLNRQLEHKIRLLMELQRERKSEAQLLESLEASSPPHPSDPQDGGQPASSKLENRNSKLGSSDSRLNSPTVTAPAASHPSATGMAQTSSCEVCDVPQGQVGTPIAGGTAEREECGSADPRCRGPRFLREATDKPRTPTPGVRATLLGAVLAAFEYIRNRGNELKDLLQRQGIIEIAASKRTHFGAPNLAIDAPGARQARAKTALPPDAGLRFEPPGLTA